MSSSRPISITGCGALSVLGHDLAAQLERIGGEATRFRPLGEMAGAPEGFEDQPTGWIEPRALLCHRKWSPLSMAALHVAREALEAADWSASERRNAAIFFGTSRGAMAGWTDAWPGRRPFRLMAASNSLGAEPASAIGSELGVGGPWQIQSSGCCAGLDALGMAKLWLDAGQASRALVVSADLPLRSAVLQAYADTGILSSRECYDPLSEKADGMIPSEGAAALCLEAEDKGDHPRLLSYFTSTEHNDPLGGAAETPALTEILTKAIELHGKPDRIIPHASGTHAQSLSEPLAIHQAASNLPPLEPMKPWTGHTVGASGLLETAILASQDHPPASLVFKIASSMGGKHSLIALRLPS
ncbi:MAG: beta-ketoacyl synthase N-terminal-like domain-containing protein [Verrucomicrobiota bacterium]